MTSSDSEQVHRRRARLDPFPAAVLETVRARRLASPVDPILVATSAGPDSTALLAALAALRAEGLVGPLFALHVDHGLRPGGTLDAEACRAACRRLGVPFEAVAVVVAPGNVQAQARRARYAALAEAAARLGATRIATGHTRTDQAETVLLRLARGAGARGLAGIPARRGALIRPLLDRSRAEGLAYLARLGLGWQDDPSNATPRYARNRLRQRLWPVLLEMNPAVESALARAADLLRDDERALSRRARQVLAGDGSAQPPRATAEVRVPLERLLAEPRAVRRRVVRLLVGRRAEVGAEHVERVLRLVSRRRSGPPGRSTLPGGLEAVVEGGTLRIRAAGSRAPAAPEVAIPVAGPGRYPAPALGLVAEVTAGEGAAPGWPLTLRTRRPGDRFRPAGGAGGKKLKAWLIDRKVAPSARDRLLLLVAGGGEVLAIPELGVVSALLPAGVGVRVEASR